MQCVPYAVILQIFLLFSIFYTAEFNSLLYPNDKIYDGVVFADRFCYQLTMFGNRIFIVLSRLLHDRIAYAIDTSKIIRRMLPNFLLFA